LFDYIATYMYEDDTPPAERRAQALSLDRDLLRELLGQEELRELIDPAALAEVETSLRPFPQDPERLYDLLRLRGDLRGGEFDEAHAAILEAERRAVRVRIAGEERLPPPPPPRPAPPAPGAAARPPLPPRAGRPPAGGSARRFPRAGGRRAALARRTLGARPWAVHNRGGVGLVR